MRGIADIDVAILAGGLGTRIRGVLGDTPKCLGPVAGRPFLDWMLDRLAAEGARRVLLLLGHRAEAVSQHVRGRPGVECVVEPAPLGTAGAIRHALPRLAHAPVLVMNGDSVVGADLAAFAAAHHRPASLLAVRVPDAGRYGALEVAPDGSVMAFREKDPGAGPGLINAGVYLLGHDILDLIAETDGPSLERDILARLPPDALGAVVAPGPFVDIGTPESYAAAAPIVLEWAKGSRP